MTINRSEQVTALLELGLIGRYVAEQFRDFTIVTKYAI